MGSVKKYKQSAVFGLLKHNSREIPNPSNKDINPAESIKNFDLITGRKISAYDYFKQRKAQLYCYNRDDVKVLAGWVITQPADLPPENQKIFFDAVYDFLNERYGKENCIQAIVHCDESGQPHLHYLFIPVVKDTKRGGEKICCSQVLNRTELRAFHQNLQKYLLSRNIQANVINGITKKNGGNKSVWQMKQERTYKREMTHERSNSRW